MKLKSVLRRAVAVLLSLACFAAVTFVAVAVIDPRDLIGFVTDDDYQDFISEYIRCAGGMTQEEWVNTYFEDYYQYISEDYWNLATGAGGMYDSDNNFSDSYLAATEQQLAMFFSGNGIPFNWSDFVDYAKARRSAELASQSFDSLDYIETNDPDPIKISAEGLKAMTAEYNSRYMPMPSPDQIVWSYQRSYDDYGLKDAKAANPAIPIYWNKYDWGGRTGWTKGIYVLPFVTDDDVSSPYYCKYYYHFYSTADEEHNITLHCDAYNLLNNQIVEADCRTWAWKNINSAELSPAVIALNLQANSGWRIQAFDSDANYFVGNIYVGNLIHRSTGGDPLFNGDLSSLSVGTTMSTLKSAASFTPDSSICDDWGAYLSSAPFQLFANQTYCDFSRLPDDYIVSITGDSFYDYSVTDTSTGDTTTINNYISNNYTFPDDDKQDDGGSSGGSSSVGGNIKVDGNVDVSGDITIKADPIDINVNINSVSSSADPDISVPSLDGVDEGQQSINDLIDYYQDSADQIGGFFSSFLSVVPAPIRNMVPLSVGLIIFLGLVYALKR